MALASPARRRSPRLALCAATVLLLGLSPAEPSPESAQSLFDRGVSYDYNGGNHPDPKVAFGWYLKAAQAGSAKGAFNVGVMYDAGRGVPHDPAAAATWYAMAAALSEPRAAYNLGELYETGEGVPKNPALAAAWFRHAARSGVAAAITRLRHLPVDYASAPTSRFTPPPVQAIVPPKDAKMKLMGNGTILVWTAEAWPYAETFYVEVVAIAPPRSQSEAGLPNEAQPEPDHPRDVFTAMTDVSALRVALPPGQYAWRVFAIDPQSAHYTPNAWTRFSLEEPL